MDRYWNIEWVNIRGLRDYVFLVKTITILYENMFLLQRHSVKIISLCKSAMETSNQLLM